MTHATDAAKLPVPGIDQTSRCVHRTAANNMAKADRDDALNNLVRFLRLVVFSGQDRNLTPGVNQASRLFAAMLDDIVVDVALQSHQEVARNRRKCDVCHTQCVFIFPFLSLSRVLDSRARCRSCRADMNVVQLRTRCVYSLLITPAASEGL